MKLFELHQQEKLDAAMALIERDCSFYLKHGPHLSHKLQMWRGVDNVRTPFSKQTARKARLPAHTPKELHEFMNDMFQKKFGWPARNGTFVTWDRDTAATYGDLYAVFPIGEFKYVWSPDVQDLYSYVADFVEEIDNAPTIEQMKKTISDLKWIDSGLQSMPTTHFNNELVIDAKEYYLMSPSMVNSIAWTTIYEAN